MSMTGSGDQMSEAEKIFRKEETDITGEAIDDDDEDKEDWKTKLLHDPRVKISIVILGVVGVLCSVRFIARKLQQQAFPLNRLHDEPEEAQSEKPVTLGSVYIRQV